MVFRHEPNGFGRRLIVALSKGQSDRYPRSLADPAADIDRAVMQLHQTFDDR